MGPFEELDTNEPLAKRMARHAYDRLIMLSDGVFAIVITLAAFEIKPPASWNGDLALLFHQLGPSLGAYAITFLVIAAFWSGQRRILSQLIGVDGFITFLFLTQLALIALQPAGVRLLVDYGQTGKPFWIYYVLILLSGFVQAIAWAYAAFFARLTHPEIGRSLKWVRMFQALLLPPLIAWVALLLSHQPSIIAVSLSLLVIVALRTLQHWADKRFTGAR